MNSPRTLELKVTLRHIRPPIWRRFHVRDDLTLAELHEALQVVMGWTGSHLHQFEARGARYRATDPVLGLPPPEVDERAVRLRDVLAKAKDQLTYEYDFGDSWEHEVVLERVLPHDPLARYPIVVAGRRACPPEDCGGAMGYARLLQVLRDPSHPEDPGLTEWAGGRLDPEVFDLRALNRLFHADWPLPGEDAPAPRPERRAPRQRTLRLGSRTRRR